MLIENPGAVGKLSLNTFLNILEYNSHRMYVHLNRVFVDLGNLFYIMDIEVMNLYQKYE